MAGVGCRCADVSDLPSPLSFDITSDANRIVKVRGLVLDMSGNPCGRAVAMNKTLACTLLAGICPVRRDGEVQNSIEWQPQRRRASTSQHKEEAKNVGRASYVAGSNSSGAVSVSSSSELGGATDADMPVTLGQECLYDWSICKYGHRQGVVTEMEDGLFAVVIPGEPLAWIFSRKPPLGGIANNGANGGRSSISGGRPSIAGTLESYFDSGSRSNRGDISRSGGMVYLMEIQFFLRLETGNVSPPSLDLSRSLSNRVTDASLPTIQGMFVPMPRHIYGELARTPEGVAHLTRRNVILDLITKSRQLMEQLTKLPGNVALSPAGQASAHMTTGSTSATLELRSWLWALGHIGASELGFATILAIDPSFVEWCIEGACSYPYFNIRGTFFHLLGLISRTSKGSQRLHQQRWDCSAPSSNCAVAIPRQPKVLFRRISSLQRVDSNPTMGMRKPRLSQRHANARAGLLPYLSQSNPPSSIRLLTPFIPSGSVSAELEVLNQIAKVRSFAHTHAHSPLRLSSSGRECVCCAAVNTTHLTLCCLCVEDAWRYPLSRLQAAAGGHPQGASGNLRQAQFVRGRAPHFGVVQLQADCTTRDPRFLHRDRSPTNHCLEQRSQSFYRGYQALG